MKMLDLINAIKVTDRYIPVIFTTGGCYQFHLMLSKLFAGCEPYINEQGNHVVTKYRGKFFDINGLVDVGLYRKLKKSDIKTVERWSFYENNFIQLGECPNCDEPLLHKVAS